MLLQEGAKDDLSQETLLLVAKHIEINKRVLSSTRPGPRIVFARCVLLGNSKECFAFLGRVNSLLGDMRPASAAW